MPQTAPVFPEEYGCLFRISYVGGPNIFVEQLYLLLDGFWGKGTWHLQTNIGTLTGVHLMCVCVFDNPLRFREVRRNLQETLASLERKYPELAKRAAGAAMAGGRWTG